MKVYQAIASSFASILSIQSREEILDDRSREIIHAHEERIERIIKDFLPSGSGIDSGTQFLEDYSKPGKLVFQADFHHINEYDHYDGWTCHRVTIKPDWDGIDIRISGPDRNQTKEYLYDTFHYAFGREIPEDHPARWVKVPQTV